VSNAEFYDNKLVISLVGANQATGIFTRSPRLETVYDRGRTRTNKGEAVVVVGKAGARYSRRPTCRWVAVTSVAQRFIQIEVPLPRTPEAEPFFCQHPNEPLEKNLRTSRAMSATLSSISIGYGRNESGQIAKEFGPSPGGWSPAPERADHPQDGDAGLRNLQGRRSGADASVKHGVRALKNFLKFETR
jgi:hypothetical protein